MGDDVSVIVPRSAEIANTGQSLRKTKLKKRKTLQTCNINSYRVNLRKFWSIPLSRVPLLTNWPRERTSCAILNDVPSCVDKNMSLTHAKKGSAYIQWTIIRCHVLRAINYFGKSSNRLSLSLKHYYTAFIRDGPVDNGSFPGHPSFKWGHASCYNFIDKINRTPLTSTNIWVQPNIMSFSIIGRYIHIHIWQGQRLPYPVSRLDSSITYSYEGLLKVRSTYVDGAEKWYRKIYGSGYKIENCTCRCKLNRGLFWSIWPNGRISKYGKGGVVNLYCCCPTNTLIIDQRQKEIEDIIHNFFATWIR